MENILQNLIGKKATLFRYNEFGFPNSTECIIQEVYNKDYAQYKNQLHIVFRPKGKSTSYLWRPMYFSTFAVFAGHIKLNFEMFVATEDQGAVTVSKSLLSFSPGYLDRALKSTDQKPIFVQRKDLINENHNRIN